MKITEQERKEKEQEWYEFLAKYGKKDRIMDTEYGIMDLRKDGMKDVVGGEKLTYNHYLHALLNSKDNKRDWFEHCYYNDAMFDFVVRSLVDCSRRYDDIFVYKKTGEHWNGKQMRRFIEDSERKLTPCLVPYENLPESEKEFDRNTAMETLKLIKKLGYTISKD